MKTTVVPFSEIKAHKIWRLEAEFYNQTSQFASDFVSGEEAIDFVQYGTSEELNENGNGYPVLRLNEFDGLFIKQPEKYCDKIDADTYGGLALKKNDVLICRTNGNPKLVGKSALVPQDYGYAFASYLFRIRPKKEIINSSTLAIYLNGKIGRAQIEKNLMISNQSNFSPAKFREIQIPVLSPVLQSSIEKLVYDAFVLQESANVIYAKTEQTLLSELGLLNWKPKHRLSFVKRFSDTKSAGRIDAEYFQPMHKDLVEQLKKYTKGHKTLGEVATIQDQNFQPEDDVMYKYVELANISTNGNMSGYTETQGKNLPSRARRKINAGDVIVSSIEGALSSIALILNDMDNALCSTGFLVINSNALNSETLLVMLKSVVGQLQLKKGCSGTILTAIGDDEFRKVILPNIPNKIQDLIKQKITEMYTAKARSNRLLEITKRGVELAIEEDEARARKWIDAELAELDCK